MKRYTCTIRDKSCTIECSDGRSATYNTTGRDDSRIAVSLKLCALAGYGVTVNHA